VATEWTVATLKEYHDQRFSDQEKAVQAALAAAEKAVTKAEMAAEKRFDAVNEFRQTLSDQQTTFVRQDVIDARMSSFEQQMKALTSQTTEARGRGVGFREMGGYVLSVIIAIVAIATFFLRH
jgi:hypothetical protein